MTPDSKDNRRHPRLPLILQAEFPDREGYLESTENLSAGGLFVRTSESLWPGARIPLRISFPGLLDSVDIIGVVVWSRPATEELPAGVGLAIPEDPPEGQRRLRELMTRLADVRAATATASSHYAILLAEDNAHAREIYDYALRKMKTDPGGNAVVEVEVAKDGQEALARLAAKRFNLLVADLDMPILDGFELIERVRASDASKEMSILVVSGSSMGSDTRARLARFNVNGYLRKPVRFVDLVETVRRLLFSA